MSRQLPVAGAADLLGRLPETLTVDEAAELLRVTPMSAARALLDGDLPHRLVGNRLVVPTRELLAQFGVQEVGPA